MALTNASVLGTIAKIHKDNPFDKHPLWKGLIDGVFGLTQVREFARQFSVFPLHNHRYHGPIYVNCPDPGWRQLIAEVVYEEGTGRLYAAGRSHNQLYVDFTGELGLDRTAIADTEFCPEVRGFKGWYEGMCNRPFLEAVSAHMLAAEAHGPGVFRHLAKSFQRRFGLSDKAVAFWVVHDVADEDHSGIGKRLLDQFATTADERRRVLTIVKQTVEMTFLMYDGILKRVQAAA